METVYFLQSFASPALDAAFLVITNLGSELTYIGLLVIAYLAFDPNASRRLGIYFLAALYVNQLLKGYFDTLRPFEIDPSVLRSEAAEATAGGAGLPSGHTQSAATFWGIAAYYLSRPWFTALALVIISLVALSRIYLGVHLPIDVIVGLALAAVTVALVPLLDRISLPGGAAWQLPAGILLPLGLHVLAPTTDSALILGGLAGFLTAPLLYRYERPAARGQRALAAVLGLLLVFAALFGSSALLPEEVKRNLFASYARYLLLAYVGLVATPAVFDLLARRSSGAQRTNGGRHRA